MLVSDFFEEVSLAKTSLDSCLGRKLMQWLGLGFIELEDDEAAMAETEATRTCYEQYNRHQTSTTSYFMVRI